VCKSGIRAYLPIGTKVIPDRLAKTKNRKTEVDVMRSAPKLNPEYVIDVNGNKKAVILSIEEYEELIEDLQDLAVVAERREEPVIPHADVMEELKQNGYLSN